MRVKIFYLVCCIMFLLRLPAQQRLIQLSNQTNPDKSISIFAENLAPVTKTVQFFFDELRGYRSSLSENFAVTTVYRGKTEILRLTPEKTAANYALKYSLHTYEGMALHKAPDTNFVYLIPANTGVIVRAGFITALESAFGQKKQPDYFGIGFEYHPGDTICAARAGIVYDCKASIDSGERTQELFKRNRNYIHIEAHDGTLDKYQITAPIDLLVTAGDRVIPGQPLAVFKPNSEKFTVLFSVSYLDEKRLRNVSKDMNAEIIAGLYHFVHPLFYSEGLTAAEIPGPGRFYQANHPYNIVSAELSKKEKKKISQENQ
jgi:hypothetical protein